jgi:UDP-N-acetyl-D-mannosaminuronic acid dehydrogenase
MISIVGLGYIGLPTALMLAASGNKVTGIDIDLTLTTHLNNGKLAFEEPGLPELFKKAIDAGILFLNEYIESDIYIIATPTPYDKHSKKIDMRYVISAFESILKVCPSHAVVVIESTIPPGSIEKHIRPRVKKNVKLAHAPERIIPGNMLYELENNPRTIGVDDNETGVLLKNIYGSFCKGEIVLTDIKTAEMSKVVENTYRDINIAFANELAKICRVGDMDVYEIIEIANKHPRVNILKPGPGVGGHCISVDPWFLVGDYPGLANIILAARRINDSMPGFVLSRLKEIMDDNHITDITRVGLYGLTYKENVDDTRESPTLQLLDCMKNHLAPSLLCYDPYVKTKIVDKQAFDLNNFLLSVDIVVIMVGHEEIVKNQVLLKNKIVFDTRKVIDTENIYYL